VDWARPLNRLRELAACVPRIGWMLAIVLLLALAGLAAVSLQGPAYMPLFEGLSPAQGGRVIDSLQKLGIPYQLNATGSVIEVPQSELARARLKLGQRGVPASPASSAWKQLTHDSVTTSATAEHALDRRATEASLEQAIERIHGVQDAQVMLAQPRETPFLQSQPKPKASVIVTAGPAGISHTQAQAIAQLVANAVPGLDTRRVTVTNQDGEVLAPRADRGVGQAQSQLAFQNRVEAQTTRHIRALLEPVLGARNLRVSVAAGIDFSQTSSRNVSYGPQGAADHVEHDQQRRVGTTPAPGGVPGSLSNQPPGNTSAPLKQRTAKSGSSSRKPLPGSRDDKWNVTYEVGRTVRRTQAPPWALKSLSVSVVVNRNALGKKGKTQISRIRDLIRGSLSAPNLSVDVVAVPFRRHPGAPADKGLMTAVTDPSLIRALLELLAAVLFLFGVARPMGRWLAAHADTWPATLRPAGVPAGAAGESEAHSGAAAAAARAISSQAQTEERRQAVQAIAVQEPEKAAELIRRWLQDDPPDPAGAEDEPS